MRVALALLALVVGCASPEALDERDVPAGLRFETDAFGYARGESTRLFLVNGTRQTFGMGVLNCAVLETQASGEWVRSPEGNDRACISILLTFEPDQTAEAVIPLDVSPGTYRFAHSLGREGAPSGAVRVTTRAFSVR